MKFASYFTNSGIVVAGCCFFSVLINGLTAYGIAIYVRFFANIWHSCYCSQFKVQA